MGPAATLTYLVKCYQATIITDIWFAVTFFAGWAATVQAISIYRTDLSISNQILTVLGM